MDKLVLKNTYIAHPPNEVGKETRKGVHSPLQSLLTVIASANLQGFPSKNMFNFEN
jgi:hypothetical protein